MLLDGYLEDSKFDEVACLDLFRLLELYSIEIGAVARAAVAQFVVPLFGAVQFRMIGRDVGLLDAEIIVVSSTYPILGFRENEFENVAVDVRGDPELQCHVYFGRRRDGEYTKRRIRYKEESKTN